MNVSIQTVAPTDLDWRGCVRGDLGIVQRIFDDELLSEVAFVNTLCRTLRAYRGKMLRPALLLLCGKATGPLTNAHRTLAAVVEMVHVATLVHDDVLDEADERRRQPTVRATSGNVTAVLLGDYLISHAFHLCSGLDSQYASRRIGDTTNTVCEGELLQNHRRWDDRLTESEYLDIVQRKTGALTAVACELGAQVGGAEPDVVDAMRRFGLSVGTAFQMVDDLLDISGDGHEAGKTLGLDFAAGKLTLPTIHYLSCADPSDAEALRACLRQGAGRPPVDLRNRLADAGSLDYAASVASRLVDEALRELDVLPGSDAKRALISAAEFTLKRTS